MFNIFVLFAFTVVAVSAADHHTCISGRLSCSTNASAAMDAKIKMITYSLAPGFELPYAIGNTASDTNGLFRVCLSANGFVLDDINKITIDHTCSAKPGCPRVFVQEVMPDNFVSDADHKMMWDMGVVDLSQEGNNSYLSEC